MRRIFLILAILVGFAPSASAQFSCTTLNGVTTCGSPIRFFDTTPRRVSTPVVDLSQTWNDPSVTFTGFKLNITDTNSASASLLADFQVGGTSKFSISKAGLMTSSSVLQGPSGSCTAGAVPYSFSGDTDTGIANIAANQLDFCVGGTSRAQVTTSNLVSAGGLVVGAGSGMQFAGRALWASPADGVLQGLNNGQTSFTRLILGTNDATANGASWTLTSGALEAKTGDATAFAALKALSLATNGASAGASGTLQLGSRITVYNGLTTAGNGVPSVVAAGSGAAISAAADTNRCSFTPGADGDFEVSDQILVTTAGSIAATATIGYTDEGNTARTQTIPFVLVAGSAIVTAIASANGTVPYNGIPVHIRAKSGVAINVSTTGTFTGSVYNHRCIIRQLQ